jgi:Domain of unknown function (DUF5615)
MTTKLFLDEDVHPGLVAALARRNIDAIHVQKLRREGMSDEAQLMEAIRLERAILTFNQKDFSLLHLSTLDRGIEHFGIIIGPQMTLSDALRRTLNLLQIHPDLRDNIWHL